ncbi:diacylglycerol kinase epsilon-like [Saccoglossus kowalevskii]|uniref:Diacylglycerol kinase n=1 Tax=Saccoglossus kowalevskii TaxID=10224 RepID=A0ABM0GWQ0_SACKO|nr:PREDICTED: diacylglycerol kinase epsilon-like [Saccoglossus kowalevskii]
MTWEDKIDTSVGSPCRNLRFLKEMVSTIQEWWEEYPYQISLCVALVFFVIWTLSKTCKRRRRLHDIPVRDITKGHRWLLKDEFRRSTYCSVCESLITHGGVCDSCSVCADDICLSAADRLFACKALSLSKQVTQSMKHHWVRGNLPLFTACCVCKAECGNLPRLSDHRCVWCQRTVHDNCLYLVKTAECDFGKYCNLIIPPYCLSLTLVGWKGRRHWSVAGVVSPPDDRNWKPILVFCNRKSGNNEGEQILSTYRSMLNPVQVVDLSEVPPEKALELCNFIPHRTCTILVCGGDGTIAWVLGAIDSMNLQTRPNIGILPLGTGNDLARVLGWGEGYSGEENLDEWLDSIVNAKVTPIDRWSLNIVNLRRFGFRKPVKALSMTNYFSLGCDASIALKFHRQRESRPSWFKNRVINKIWYFFFGARDALLEQECKNFHKKVTLELDGAAVQLPEIGGIVVLNINSWGAGCALWGTSTGGNNIPKSRSVLVCELPSYF